MAGYDDQENLLILRGLLLLRLLLLTPFFPAIITHTACDPGLATTLVVLLLVMAGLPTLIYFLNRDWLARPSVPRIIVLFDFLFASVLSLIASSGQGMPIFFPLYFAVVAVEAACWWGWPGALISGAAGGALLSWLYMSSEFLQPNQGLAMVALVMAWPVVLGYFTQWALRQWRERRRIASWLSQQENMVRQVRERLDGWNATCAALQAVTSPQDLLRTALGEAMAHTGSALGLVVMRDRYSGVFRPECWEGFALPGSHSTTLRPADQLPALEGAGMIEVRYVLEAPLRAGSPHSPEGDPMDMGRIIVARPGSIPYVEGAGQWLQVMTSYTAALLENRFLKGQLGRLHDEADSILLAFSTLSSLSDPAAAMEMACRNVLGVLELDQVVIFLYGEEGTQGCQVIVYPAEQPARKATIPLQGKGLRVLRRFLDGGTSLIVNRRNEWPEIFDLMAWEEKVQAIACFPLYVLERRWGALCLLASIPDAFPSQTQQNLAIFSGEVAMALENFYLRQTVTGVEL